jgi:hypothetical protein
MILAPLIVAKGRTDQAAPAAKWLAGILSAADRRILTTEDIARIESYDGDGRVLHDILPTILPLPRAIWYEATAIADRGMQRIGNKHYRPLCFPSAGRSHFDRSAIAAASSAISYCRPPKPYLAAMHGEIPTMFLAAAPKCEAPHRCQGLLRCRSK